MCRKDINKCLFKQDATPQLDLLLAGTNPHQLGGCMYILVYIYICISTINPRVIGVGPNKVIPKDGAGLARPQEYCSLGRLGCLPSLGRERTGFVGKIYTGKHRFSHEDHGAKPG